MRHDTTLPTECHVTVCDSSLDPSYLAHALRRDACQRLSYDSLCQLPHQIISWHMRHDATVGAGCHMTVCDSFLNPDPFLAYSPRSLALGVVQQSETGYWPQLISWQLRCDATLGAGCRTTVCDRSLALAHFLHMRRDATLSAGCRMTVYDRSLALAHFLAYAPRRDAWRRVSYDSLRQLSEPRSFLGIHAAKLGAWCRTTV